MERQGSLKVRMGVKRGYEERKEEQAFQDSWKKHLLFESCCGRAQVSLQKDGKEESKTLI
jgi:hypothetical protein